ncbi:prepilin peptidase [Pseudomonas sp. QL9]|uniref:A24 family peptidase n=1 Tax=Pseudomonas sp. QL9 TaxID=3242725 RepID=UPI003529E893
MNSTLIYIQPCIILWLMLAAYQDVRRRRVSNLLTLGGGALAALWLILEHRSLTGHSVPAALLAAVLALLLTVPGYLLGKLGAADVKLLPALGLATGPQTLMNTFALACLVTVLLMLGSRSLLRNANISQPIARHLRSISVGNSKPFPFIFALFVGYLLDLLFISKFLY